MGSLHNMYRYLFPPRPAKQQLPLLSLRYSSSDCPFTHSEDSEELFKAAGIIRTSADGTRLRYEYRGKPDAYIIRLEKRVRRFRNRFYRAWQRFLRRW